MEEYFGEEVLEKKFVCVLCNEVAEGHGHNPEPLAKEGRCCDKCNNEVIARRFMDMMR